jgi:hypothetical protein
MPSIQSILSKPCVASANERQTYPPLNKTQRPLCARSRRSRSLWTKPQTSEKVKTFLPTSDALRAIAIEVLGYSNVGQLGSRHT